MSYYFLVIARRNSSEFTSPTKRSETLPARHDMERFPTDGWGAPGLGA